MRIRRKNRDLVQHAANTANYKQGRFLYVNIQKMPVCNEACIIRKPYILLFQLNIYT